MSETTLDKVASFSVLISVIWSMVGPFVTAIKDPMILSFIVAFPYMFVHGFRWYGQQALWIFVITTFIISNFWENLSIATGFPFGWYHYTLPFKLFAVPLIIGPAYISIGYVSWQVTNAALGFAEERLRSSTVDTFVLPAMAAFVMTAWDVSEDPRAATLNQTWIWHYGGGFYGVPLGNFLGWWLCTYTFFQIYAFYLRSKKYQPLDRRTTLSYVEPIILYLNLAFIKFGFYFMTRESTKVVTDQNGMMWREADIYECNVLVALFALFPFSLFALYQVYLRSLDGPSGTEIMSA
jgi:putative membrane protein